MIDLIKKGILTGVGFGLMTKEKVVDYAKKAAKEAKLTEAEGRKLVDELLNHSEETRKELEKKINDQVKNTLDQVGVATKEDINELKKIIDKLQNRVEGKTKR
jgi:polyhydroxyalkanoate synthesis regulator phasin